MFTDLKAKELSIFIRKSILESMIIGLRITSWIAKEDKNKFMSIIKEMGQLSHELKSDLTK